MADEFADITFGSTPAPEQTLITPPGGFRSNPEEAASLFTDTLSLGENQFGLDQPTGDVAVGASNDPLIDPDVASSWAKNEAAAFWQDDENDGPDDTFKRIATNPNLPVADRLNAVRAYETEAASGLFDAADKPHQYFQAMDGLARDATKARVALWRQHSRQRVKELFPNIDERRDFFANVSQFGYDDIGAYPDGPQQDAIQTLNREYHDMMTDTTRTVRGGRVMNTDNTTVANYTVQKTPDNQAMVSLLFPKKMEDQAQAKSMDDLFERAKVRMPYPDEANIRSRIADLEKQHHDALIYADIARSPVSAADISPSGTGEAEALAYEQDASRLQQQIDILKAGGQRAGDLALDLDIADRIKGDETLLAKIASGGFLGGAERSVKNFLIDAEATVESIPFLGAAKNWLNGQERGYIVKTGAETKQSVAEVTLGSQRRRFEGGLLNNVLVGTEDNIAQIGAQVGSVFLAGGWARVLGMSQPSVLAARMFSFAPIATVFGGSQIEVERRAQMAEARGDLEGAKKLRDAAFSYSATNMAVEFLSEMIFPDSQARVGRSFMRGFRHAGMDVFKEAFEEPFAGIGHDLLDNPILGEYNHPFDPVTRGTEFLTGAAMFSFQIPAQRLANRMMYGSEDEQIRRSLTAEQKKQADILAHIQDATSPAPVNTSDQMLPVASEDGSTRLVLNPSYVSKNDATGKWTIADPEWNQRAKASGMTTEFDTEEEASATSRSRYQLHYEHEIKQLLQGGETEKAAAALMGTNIIFQAALAGNGAFTAEDVFHNVLVRPTPVNQPAAPSAPIEPQQTPAESQQTPAEPQQPSVQEPEAASSPAPAIPASGNEATVSQHDVELSPPASTPIPNEQQSHQQNAASQQQEAKASLAADQGRQEQRAEEGSHVQYPAPRIEVTPDATQSTGSKASNLFEAVKDAIDSNEWMRRAFKATGFRMSIVSGNEFEAKTGKRNAFAVTFSKDGKPVIMINASVHFGESAAMTTGHEIIHAADIAYSQTSEGKILFEQIVEDLETGTEPWVAELHGLMRGEYGDKWNSMDGVTKARESIRAIILGRFTGHTGNRNLKDSSLLDYLHGFFDWIMRTLGGDSPESSLKTYVHNLEQFIRDAEGEPPTSGSAGGLFEDAPVTTQQDAEYMQAVKAGDMETAQRMVDEAAKAAGYNVGPVYHAGKVVDRFDKSKIGTGRGNADLGRGFYFHEDKDVVESVYGEEGPIKAFYIKAQNPLDIQVGFSGNHRFEQRETDGYDSARRVIFDKDEESGTVDIVPLGEWVVWNPNQAKSADPVTYDEQGNPIPLSQRFNAQSDSILYEDAPVTPQQYARHAELEAKHDAGTITPEETAEAQRIVDEAARAAGYNVGPVWHGSNAEFDRFDPEKTDDPNGFWFSENRNWASRHGITKPFFLRNPKTFGGEDFVMPSNRGGDIKSADPFTGVPLSRRFDSQSDNILYEDTPSSIEVATVADTTGELVPSDQILVAHLSAATGTIPGIDKLTKEAIAGDESAARLVNDIARDAIDHLIGGIPSVRITYSPAIGLYGGSLEPSLGLEVGFDLAHRDQVLAGLAKFSSNYNQEQIHVLQSDGGVSGETHDDGSYNTLVVAWKRGEHSHNDLHRIASEAGLFGFTVADDRVEAYFVGDPSSTDEIEAFEQAANRASESLERLASEVNRLWVYGKGAIPYSSIEGAVSPQAAGSSNTARRIAARLARREVTPVKPADKITKQQAELQKRISDAYEAMRLNALDDPMVRRAYTELADELLEQFDALPVKVEILSGQGEPYKSSKEMRNDVLTNNHLFIFGTDSATFGPEGIVYNDHPLLRDSGRLDINGRPMLYNDLLRAVHDYYAHTMTEAQFGVLGEEAAWANHMEMTRSPWARLALTSETRGQNSYVNFGPNAEHNKTNKENTIFAPQKVDLLPVEFAKTGNPELDAQMDQVGALIQNSLDQQKASDRMLYEDEPNTKPRYQGEDARTKAAILAAERLRQAAAAIQSDPSAGDGTVEGARKVAEIARNIGVPIVAHDPSAWLEDVQEIQGGREHKVWVYRDKETGGQRVLKALKSVNMGLNTDEGGGLSLTKADYLTRFLLGNLIFGDDARIEGVTSTGRMFISQPFYAGSRPTGMNIMRGMTSLGLVQLYPGTTDYHNWKTPDGSVVLADVHRDNAILLNDGRLMPIDVAFFSAAQDAWIEDRRAYEKANGTDDPMSLTEFVGMAESLDDLGMSATVNKTLTDEGGRFYYEEEPAKESQRGISASISGARKGQGKGRGKGTSPPQEGAVKNWVGRKIQLTHWGKYEIKRTDPKFHGTGGMGKERDRSIYSNYRPRTFFAYGRHRREHMIGNNRHVTIVDGGLIYDYKRDPLNLFPSSDEMRSMGHAPYDMRASVNVYENRIVDAGYLGYANRDFHVVALFKPMSVRKVKDSDVPAPHYGPYFYEDAPASGNGDESYTDAVQQKSRSAAIADIGAVINLGKKADVITLLHEMVHAISVMQAHVDPRDPGKGTRSLLELITGPRFVDLHLFATKDGDIDPSSAPGHRVYLERLAEGFERWLMEGELPAGADPKLLQAFRDIREAMARIIKGLRDGNVIYGLTVGGDEDMTPEVLTSYQTLMARIDESRALDGFVPFSHSVVQAAREMHNAALLALAANGEMPRLYQNRSEALTFIEAAPLITIATSHLITVFNGKAPKTIEEFRASIAAIPNHPLNGVNDGQLSLIIDAAMVAIPGQKEAEIRDRILGNNNGILSLPPANIEEYRNEVLGALNNAIDTEPDADARKGMKAIREQVRKAKTKDRLDIATQRAARAVGRASGDNARRSNAKLRTLMAGWRAGQKDTTIAKIADEVRTAFGQQIKARGIRSATRNLVNQVLNGAKLAEKGQLNPADYLLIVEHAAQLLEADTAKASVAAFASGLKSGVKLTKDEVKIRAGMLLDLIKQEIKGVDGASKKLLMSVAKSLPKLTTDAQLARAASIIQRAFAGQRRLEAYRNAKRGAANVKRNLRKGMFGAASELFMELASVATHHIPDHLLPDYLALTGYLGSSAKAILVNDAVVTSAKDWVTQFQTHLLANPPNVVTRSAATVAALAAKEAAAKSNALNEFAAAAAAADRDAFVHGQMTKFGRTKDQANAALSVLNQFLDHVLSATPADLDHYTSGGIFGIAGAMRNFNEGVAQAHIVKAGHDLATRSLHDQLFPILEQAVRHVLGAQAGDSLKDITADEWDRRATSIADSLLMLSAGGRLTSKQLQKKLHAAGLYHFDSLLGTVGALNEMIVTPLTRLATLGELNRAAILDSRIDLGHHGIGLFYDLVKDHELDSSIGDKLYAAMKRNGLFDVRLWQTNQGALRGVAGAIGSATSAIPGLSRAYIREAISRIIGIAMIQRQREANGWSESVSATGGALEGNYVQWLVSSGDAGNVSGEFARLEAVRQTVAAKAILDALNGKAPTWDNIKGLLSPSNLRFIELADRITDSTGQVVYHLNFMDENNPLEMFASYYPIRDMSGRGGKESISSTIARTSLPLPTGASPSGTPVGAQAQSRNRRTDTSLKLIDADAFGVIRSHVGQVTADAAMSPFLNQMNAAMGRVSREGELGGSGSTVVGQINQELLEHGARMAHGIMMDHDIPVAIFSWLKAKMRELPLAAATRPITEAPANFVRAFVSMGKPLIRGMMSYLSNTSFAAKVMVGLHAPIAFRTGSASLEMDFNGLNAAVGSALAADFQLPGPLDYISSAWHEADRSPAKAGLWGFVQGNRLARATKSMSHLLTMWGEMMIARPMWWGVFTLSLERQSGVAFSEQAYSSGAYSKDQIDRAVAEAENAVSRKFAESAKGTQPNKGQEPLMSKEDGAASFVRFINYAFTSYMGAQMRDFFASLKGLIGNNGSQYDRRQALAGMTSIVAANVVNAVMVSSVYQLLSAALPSGNPEDDRRRKRRMQEYFQSMTGGNGIDGAVAFWSKMVLRGAFGAAFGGRTFATRLGLAAVLEGLNYKLGNHVTWSGAYDPFKDNITFEVPSSVSSFLVGHLNGDKDWRLRGDQDLYATSILSAHQFLGLATIMAERGVSMWRSAANIYDRRIKGDEIDDSNSIQNLAAMGLFALNALPIAATVLNSIGPAEAASNPAYTTREKKKDERAADKLARQFVESGDPRFRQDAAEQSADALARFDEQVKKWSMLKAEIGRFEANQEQHAFMESALNTMSRIESDKMPQRFLNLHRQAIALGIGSQFLVSVARLSKAGFSSMPDRGVGSEDFNSIKSQEEASYNDGVSTLRRYYYGAARTVK